MGRSEWFAVAGEDKSLEIVNKAILEMEAREASRPRGMWRSFGCWPEKW